MFAIALALLELGRLVHRVHDDDNTTRNKSSGRLCLQTTTTMMARTRPIWPLPVSSECVCLPAWPAQVPSRALQIDTCRYVFIFILAPVCSHQKTAATLLRQRDSLRVVGRGQAEWKVHLSHLAASLDPHLTHSLCGLAPVLVARSLAPTLTNRETDNNDCDTVALVAGLDDC